MAMNMTINVTNGTVNGDHGKSTSDAIVGGVNVTAYNIIFCLAFLGLACFFGFKTFSLRKQGYYSTITPFKIGTNVMPLLFCIAFWQFLICLVLGSSSTNISTNNALSGVFQ